MTSSNQSNTPANARSHARHAAPRTFPSRPNTGWRRSRRIGLIVAGTTSMIVSATVSWRLLTPAEASTIGTPVLMAVLGLAVLPLLTVAALLLDRTAIIRQRQERVTAMSEDEPDAGAGSDHDADLDQDGLDQDGPARPRRSERTPGRHVSSRRASETASRSESPRSATAS